MDQHLGDHQAFLVRHEGLALERRPLAGRIGKEAGGDGGHAGQQQFAEDLVDRAQRFRLRYHGRKRQFSWTIRRMRPSTRRASASAAAKVGASGFWQSTAIDAGGGDVDQRGMGFARRGDVEGVDLLGREQAVEPVKDGGDAESRGALPRPTDIGIADRHHHGAPLARPGDEVVVTDHPGPDDADPQRWPSRPAVLAVIVMVHQPKQARRIVPQHLRAIGASGKPAGERIAQCAVVGPLVDAEEGPVRAPQAAGGAEGLDERCGMIIELAE